jgi:adhesin transport system outer membrane protein
MIRKVLVPLTLISIYSEADTLKNLLHEVVTSHPQIQASQYDCDIKKLDTAIAKSEYLPRLDLSATSGKEEIDRTPTGGTTATTDYTSNLANAILEYNLFNGFATTHTVSENKFAHAMSAHSFINTLNTVSMDLTDAYIEVLRNEALLKTAQENVQINEEIFSKVNKLFKSGLSTLSEVNKIESSLSLAKSNAVISEKRRDDASYKLKELVGRSVDISILETPKFKGQIPVKFELAHEFALKNNPSILAAKESIKKSEAAKLAAAGDYYPSVDLEVSQAFSEKASGYDGEEEKFRAMLSLNFNLFNGFSDQNSIEKKAVQIQKEQKNLESDIRKTTMNIENAWTTYSKQTDQLKHLNDYKDFSKKTLSLYKKEYDLGRRSLLDLLSAQNDFIGAKSQIINTEFDVLLAKYKILKEMGLLTATLLDDAADLYTAVGLSTPQTVPYSASMVNPE